MVDISIIVPVYNVEEYLSSCVDSIMNQGELCLEIILVDDGSTDRSGEIAGQYANKDNRIKVIHRENGGASAARNTGLEIAQGEYIVFVDSDDWVKKDSLCALFREAVRYQADVVMGNMLFYYLDGSLDNPYKPASKDIIKVPLSGKEGFVRLAELGAYSPMACNYIYRRRYLEAIQARFEEGIMHEDELWCPIVLYKSETFVVVDVVFYYYRQRDGSVMHASNRLQRSNALFRVTDRLMAFAGTLDFSGEDGAFKNWLYVSIFILYPKAFMYLYHLKDTSYETPKYHLDRYWLDCWEMMPVPQILCRFYYNLAVSELKRYTDWRTSDLVASIAPQIRSGKKLMLIYNTISEEMAGFAFNNLNVLSDIPTDWIITDDRRYFQQANVVIFYLPELALEMENDLEKPEGQIWVGRILKEKENEYPCVNEPEYRELFDFWAYYPEDDLKKYLW